MGDPETQPILHRMSSDFLPALLASSTGGLRDIKLSWKSEPSVCVVMASGGYPGSYENGKPIHGIDNAEAHGTTVFHAGTRLGPNGLETSGGRVLGVTASGADLRAAIDAAYRGVDQIQFDEMQFRRDIGHKGLQRRSG
jgi:phosphoribosylamine--glycine ligase